MPDLAASQNLIDRAIAWVSPERAARRMVARSQMAMADGAFRRGRGRDRFAQGYGSSTSVRGGSSSDRRAQADERDRARHAYERNVIAQSLLNSETDYVVAEGFNLQMQSSSDAFNKEAERRYYEWLDVADASGQRTGTELVRATWLFSRMDGDGALLRVTDALGRPRLQFVPGDSIESPYGMAASRTMFDGIECDPQSMRPTTFYIASYDQAGQRTCTPFDAANVSFLSHVSHPLALRGTSVFSSIFDTLDQIDNYRDSVTKAAIMACIFGLIHRVNNPGQTLQGLGMQQNAGGTDQKVVSLENGMLRVEGTAESTYQVNATQPMQQTPEFIRTLFRIACLAFDMPLEIGSRDLSQVSFAGGRIGLLGFYRSCRIKVEKLLSRCWRPTTEWWLDVERERQRLEFADAFKTPFPPDYRSFALAGREYESNDRLNEAQADVLEIAIGKTSPQQVANNAGREYESNMAEIATHYARSRRENIPIALSSLTRDPPALATNADGETSIAQVRSVVDAFGVGVRAGGLTPQITDEENLRSALRLPPMSDAARQSWEDDGGVRKPITLAQVADTVAPPAA